MRTLYFRYKILLKGGSWKEWGTHLKTIPQTLRSFSFLCISICLGEELELRNLTREMAGTYICYADNGVSQNPVWQAININILCKYI